MDIGLSSIHTQIEPILRAAEKIILNSLNTNYFVYEKVGLASQASIVTDVDRKVDLFFRLSIIVI